MLYQPCNILNWAEMWGNVPSDMCAKPSLKSACASAQSDYSFHCPPEEALHPWLSKLRAVKIRIRLRECAGWSESSLSAYVRRYIAWRCSSNISFTRQRYIALHEKKRCLPLEFSYNFKFCWRHEQFKMPSRITNKSNISCVEHLFVSESATSVLNNQSTVLLHI